MDSSLVEPGCSEQLPGDFRAKHQDFLVPNPATTLTPNDSRALFSLDPRTGRSMRSLADEWQCDPSNATFIVDRLEEWRLARRQPLLHDKRVTLVVLTRKCEKDAHGSAPRVPSAAAGIRPPRAHRPRSARAHAGQIGTRFLGGRRITPPLVRWKESSLVSQRPRRVRRSQATSSPEWHGKSERRSRLKSRAASVKVKIPTRRPFLVTSALPMCCDDRCSST